MGRVHIDLFSGLGGFALASEWAGWDVRLFCEIDSYCRDVLAKHWPDVPVHEDICTLTAEVVRDYGITEKVDLVTGGFPCQPWSKFGRRLGASDQRHLWPEMHRFIDEVRPRYVIGENVRGLVSKGLDDIIDDLGAIGYDSQVVVLGAVALNAPHRRDRIWILSTDTTAEPTLEPVRSTIDNKFLDPRWHGDPLAAWEEGWDEGIEKTLEGEPRRTPKLRATGNAVVPQIPYVLLTSLLKAERTFHERKTDHP